MKIISLAVFCLALLAAPFSSRAAQSPTEILSFFIGTWTGTTKFPSDATLSNVACSVQGTKAVAGKYLQLDLNMFLPGQPDETMLMLTFDPTTRLYEAWTFNQHSAGAHMTTGPYAVDPKDTGKLVLASPGVVEKGENIAYRETLHIDTREQFTLTYEVRHYDAAKKADVWSVVYSSVYTRKK